jgi:hypothetical protein
MKGFTHMRRIVWLGNWLLPLLSLTACSNLFPTLDLSPPYQPPEYVVPASWHGSSPFIEANPSDGDLRPDWWTLYDDPALNTLIEQAMAANPDLEAAAERFVQARDMMMKARSQYLPRLGLGFGASDNRASANALFFPRDISQEASSVSLGGLASWEPDFWSALRNATRIETYRAEERAADYGLARLSLQAEIGANYFLLRGYDAQIAIYTQSIDLYRRSLDIVKAQFAGAIASALDVARVESLLFTHGYKDNDKLPNKRSPSLSIWRRPALSSNPRQPRICAWRVSPFRGRSLRRCLNADRTSPGWSVRWRRRAGPSASRGRLFSPM